MYPDEEADDDNLPKTGEDEETNQQELSHRAPRDEEGSAGSSIARSHGE
jgi:hypothetical protein